MNSAIVRFISAFIPSAPARRAFRNRHNLARLVAAGENAISIDPSDYGRIRLRVIGSGNVIKIGKMRPGRGVLDVLLCGDGCDVSIGDGLRIARCLKVTLGQMEKGYGKIRHAALQIGRDVGVEEAQIITYNGNSTIRIGDETMVAYGVTIYNTDSHPVYDRATRKILNTVGELSIGHHVWIGAHASLLKNTTVPDGCIVGWGAVVTRRFSKPNTAIGGNPACELGGAGTVEWGRYDPAYIANEGHRS